MKQKIDTLILNGYIVPMNDAGDLIEHGAVAVDQGKILEVGKTSKLEQKYTAEKTIDATRMAVTPGLIDTYGHAGHGMIGGFYHPLYGWSSRDLYWRYSTPEWWYAEAKLAATERLRFGTTTGTSIIGATPARADSPIFAYKNAEAYTEVGIRGVFGVGPPDVYVPHIAVPWKGGFYENGEWVQREFTYDQALNNTVKVINKWHRGSDDRIRIAISSAYIFGRQGSKTRYGHDYTPEEAKVVGEKATEIRELADKHEVQIHTHIFKGAIDFALENLGKEKVDEILGPDVVIAHGNGLTPTEIEAVGRNKCTVATAPSTGENVWYGYAPVLELLRAGANVTITTDGTAPRFNFDLWKDIVRAIWHQWIAHGNPQPLPVGKALRMVTIDAAKALGIDDQVGSLEPGKKADIVLVDLNKPHLTPQTFVPNLLVHYINGSDVDTVMVDGKVLMEGTIINSVDVDEVMENARNEAEKSYEHVDLSKFRTTDRTFWHGIWGDQ